MRFEYKQSAQLFTSHLPSVPWNNWPCPHPREEACFFWGQSLCPGPTFIPRSGASEQVAVARTKNGSKPHLLLPDLWGPLSLLSFLRGHTDMEPGGQDSSR